MQNSVWIGRLGRIALWASVLGVAAAAIGATLARYDAVEKITGFMGLFVGLPLVLLTGALALIVLLVAALRKRGPKRPAAIALGLSALLVALVLAQAGPGLSAPALHDISTDLDDPPAFEKLALRPDNLAGVDTAARWKTMHRQGYGDIRTVTLNRPIAGVIADAERLARARGWQVALADPATGRFEATAQASYFRFNDDVVLRAKANPDGGSTVDMRSVSRVGVGDLGINAARVRAFLADLQKG